MNLETVHLIGRLFLSFNIRLLTGLHVGGSPGTLAIGNVDNPVIRNPLNTQPYIPGSSLRGKMRSQFEKDTRVSQSPQVGEIRMHICDNKASYDKCPVCKTFGIPSSEEYAEVSRLIVRDAFLTEDSEKTLRNLRLDQPYTEVKTEVVIDRITAKAMPRQQERVPAGAIFQGSITFSLYNNSDIQYFKNVLKSLELVEEDYLGGQGARGSGQVIFEDLKLRVRGIQPLSDNNLIEEPILKKLIQSWDICLKEMI